MTSFKFKILILSEATLRMAVTDEFWMDNFVYFLVKCDDEVGNSFTCDVREVTDGKGKSKIS